MTKFVVALWLAAVTGANLLTAAYGPDWSIICAFALIGPTLLLRDVLHDRWRTGRAWKMGALIATGGALAYLASPDAGTIGMASCVAFALAETADGVVYHLARFWPWAERASASNLVGAAVDSVVFPYLAFGGLLWSVTVGQFGAKVAGAAILVLLVERRRRKVAVA
jgi:hypothetical protein